MKITKSTWTEWQDRDGIYLLLPGSNSVYVGFANEQEASDFAATLTGAWRVHRHGIYREMTDAEAASSPEIRSLRIRYGFHVDPLY